MTCRAQRAKGTNCMRMVLFAEITGGIGSRKNTKGTEVYAIRLEIRYPQFEMGDTP